MFLKSIVLLCYLTLNYGFNTVLNIEELNSIHYNIDIVSNPVLKEQEWTTDIVTVTNKQGQEYVCTLPKVEITENENKKDEDILDQLVDISELLKPMEAAPCIIKRKDWWSYEFCYGSVIKQYHLEDNKVTGTILILGKYESEYNWRNSSETKNKLQKFHSQFYVNGTRCDITGEPRRTEVRFHCEEGVGDYIQQVEEPESCRYVLTIATTRLCHHPYLRPSPNRSPHSISCAPALNQEQYEQYERLQISKNLKAERKNQLFLDNKYADGDSNIDAELVGNSGDEEDTKWSIQLVTIPMSKKGKNGKAIARKFSEKIGRTVAVEDIHNNLVDEDAADIDDYEDSLKEHLNKWSSSRISEDIQSQSSYLSEEELIEKEIDTLLNDIDNNKETKKKDSNEIELDPPEKALKQIKSIRNKMNKMMGKWMEIQNDEHMQELSLKIDKDLAENEKRLQDSSKLPSDILSDYVDGIVKITNNYKTEVEKKLADMEDLETEEELQLVNILETLKKTLTDADKEVILAKQRIQTLEKLLDSKFSESKEDELDDSSPDSSIEDSSLHDGEMGSSSSFSTHPSTNSDPQTYTEEDILNSNKEDTEGQILQVIKNVTSLFSFGKTKRHFLVIRPGKYHSSQTGKHNLLTTKYGHSVPRRTLTYFSSRILNGHLLKSIHSKHRTRQTQRNLVTKVTKHHPIPQRISSYVFPMSLKFIRLHNSLSSFSSNANSRFRSSVRQIHRYPLASRASSGSTSLLHISHFHYFIYKRLSKPPKFKNSKLAFSSFIKKLRPPMKIHSTTLGGYPSRLAFASTFCG